MAVYAAQVSLMHSIEQIQHHPLPLISLDQKHVESLTKKVTFLQEFLEGYFPVAGSSKEAAEDWENRIADAAYAAEDIIKSHIVEQIHAGSTSNVEEISYDEEMIISDKEISSNDLYQGLKKVIEDMDFIMKATMEIKDNMVVQDQLQRNSSISSSRSSSTGQKSTMVGFDDVLYQMMDKLMGLQHNRQIIPIVGMGGICKTTLARNIYENEVLVHHFDIRVWVMISQEYRMREILFLKLLQEGVGNLSQINEYQLGEKLHKKSSGRRYLIIIDDLWDIEVWDHMITCRLSNLASQMAGSHGVEMSFLDEDNSWNLFCKNVFGEGDCPPEIKKTEKKIA